MKNKTTLIILIIISLVVGRNLSFLPKFNLFSNDAKKMASLKKEVIDIIKKKKGNYGVYFSSLKSNKIFFGINENQTYTAASLNKVPIVATLYYMAGKGEINLDEKITIQKEDTQDYGTGSLRYEKPGSVYSLKTLTKLSLQQSDNTAAYIIATKIGMDNIQKIINMWGLTETSMSNNKTSLVDMFTLLKKIYDRKITNSSLTKELLDFLTNTDIEDRLPDLLPWNTIVYHKTGDTISGIHDVGIIQKGNNPFFLGVMTSDIGDREETEQTIARIAKKVFDFETNRQ